MEMSSRWKPGADPIAGLYRKYRGRMIRTCLRMLKDPQEAEDTCHDAFIKAIQGWNCFEGRAQAATWITSICLNECRTRLRTRKLRAARLMENLMLEKPEVAHDPVYFAWKCVLGREKEKLKPHLRKVIDLHLEDGLNHREIAEVMRVSRVYVTQLLGRAKMILNGECEPGERAAARRLVIGRKIG